MATIDRKENSPLVSLPVREARARSLPLPKRMGRVLVTGANGFLGSNLTVALASMGVDCLAAVRANKRIPKELASPVMAMKYRDVNYDSIAQLTQAVEDVDTIVHAAGAVAAVNYRQFLEVNRRATLRLLQAADRCGRKPRVVLISSIAASGPRTGEEPRTAEAVPAPVSLYGRSKLAGENIAREFADRLPITILRPGIIFGPGDREVLRLIKMIAHSRVNFIPGYHLPKFPFIAVQDLVDCIIKAIDVGSTLFAHPKEASPSLLGEGIYYVADPQMCSMAQFGRWVSKALGQNWSLTIPVPIRTLRNAAIINAKFLADPKKPNTFSVDKIREAGAKGWECDVSKTMHELHWSPEALLDQRLRETIAWYRQQHWL